jgi:hypothetical protein
LSQRHVKRLKAKVRERGIAAGSWKQGRKPKHAVPKETKEAVVACCGQIQRCQLPAYVGVLREQEGISISAKTIADFLRKPQSPTHTHKAPGTHRRSRNRMPKEGRLVQKEEVIRCPYT